MKEDKIKTDTSIALTAEDLSSIPAEGSNRNRKIKGQSRMISDAIISSGRFLKLSDKAKVLYMYLMVKTDDEGAVEAYPAMILIGASADVLEELIGKRFVIRLNDDDVVCVKDFFEQNTLRPDRTKPSRYHDLIADICPQNAAGCQHNINQSNLTECNPIKPNIRESNTTQSKSVQEDEPSEEDDRGEYYVYNPKEEYVIPYVMDRFGYKYGLSEDDVRHLAELADMLESILRETDHDPDGSGYEWMQEYLAIKFRALEHEISVKEIRNKYSYLKAMIENDLRSEGKIPEVYHDTRKAG